MTNNYYRGAKVNQNAQQNQSVEKPADGYVYRGVRHQAQQQSDVATNVRNLQRCKMVRGGREKRSNAIISQT